MPVNLDLDNLYVLATEAYSGGGECIGPPPPPRHERRKERKLLKKEKLRKEMQNIYDGEIFINLGGL